MCRALQTDEPTVDPTKRRADVTDTELSARYLAYVTALNERRFDDLIGVPSVSASSGLLDLAVRVAGSVCRCRSMLYGSVPAYWMTSLRSPARPARFSGAYLTWLPGEKLIP